MPKPVNVLAIDPGHLESAWMVYHLPSKKPHAWGIDTNPDLIARMRDASWFQRIDHAVVEMVASYGMAVGQEVFETCVWIGRFVECWGQRGIPELMLRKEVKLHHCGKVHANDANIRAAILDRYGPGRDIAVGTMKKPGPLHGVKADAWAALALAITWAERRANER